MIAMSIALIGLTGLLSVQVMVARSNHYSQHVRQASALATDLEENIQRWGYNDARLGNVIPVTSFSATAITDRWTMGNTAVTGTASRAVFAEQASDLNATVSTAGTTYGTTLFSGLNPDVDGDGIVDFKRYWTVFEVNLTGSTIADGKFVQIIARWKEPVLGYRQIATSTFIANPAAAAQ